MPILDHNQKKYFSILVLFSDFSFVKNNRLTSYYSPSLFKGFYLIQQNNIQEKNISDILSIWIFSHYSRSMNRF